MKILYLPIIEPGAFHEVALKNKRGLLDALIARGHEVRQFDYMAFEGEIYDMVASLVVKDETDLLLMQLHGPDHLSPSELRALRALRPNMKIINWSGDSWLHSLTSPDMMAMCQELDMQLVASPDVLASYEMAKIRAHYWQIAYERPVGDLPDMPTYDVVFLGNVINDKRREMLEMLRALPYRVGIYGDWEHADGHNTYDFGAGEALYKNAKLAIADNVYPDSQNYISNRPFQILMAGGALMLHQRVEKMEALAGLQVDIDYIEWLTLFHLDYLIKRYVNPARDMTDIINGGESYALQHHTYAQRVDQLFDEFLPELEAVS